MAKRNLSALLDTSITETPAGDGTPAAQSGETERDTAQPAAPTSNPPAAPAPPARQAQPAQPRIRASGPRYLELDRKELRIRGDQADDLTTLTRQLNRARKSEGERITDNTLIRVAIDLLMRDRDKLRGATEADLLKSVLPD
jgi:hypothetical protein